MFKCIKRKEKEIEFINEDGEKILSYLYSAKNFSKKFLPVFYAIEHQVVK